MSRGRRHLTRTAIGLLAAIAVWMGLLALGLWVVGLPGTRVWLAGELTSRLTRAVGQPVRVSDAGVSLDPPRLVVRGVEVGPPGAPVLKVDLAEVLVGRIRLATREVDIDNLRLVGVSVDLQALPTAPRSRGGAWVSVVVRQLELEDLQIQRLAIPGGTLISARDVDARWSGSRRSPINAAVLHIGSFTISPPGVEPISGSVTAWGRKTAGGWELGRLRAGGNGWQVTASGDQTRDVVRASGTLDFELSRLDRTLHIGAGLAGRVALQWQASRQGGDFRVDATVRAPEAGVAGLEFQELDGLLHVSPEGLEASVARLGFAGGKFEGSYTLAGFGPPWSHRVAVRGDGASLARFLRLLGADDAGLSASAAVNADVAWDGAAFKKGSGTGIADLAPGRGDVPVSGRLVVSLAGDGVLGFDGRNLLLAGAPVAWQGGLALGTWVPSWKVQGDKVPLTAIARLLRGWVGSDVLPPELRGEAALDIALRGPFRDIEVEGTVAVAPISFGPVEADGLEASFRAGHGMLSVPSGAVVVGPGRVNVSGELAYGAGLGLQFEIGGGGVPLARVVAWGGIRAPLEGQVKVAGTLTGTVASPRADANIELERVSVAGVPFGNGAGQATLAGGVVTVSGLAVGPFAASARVDLAKREASVDAKLSGFGLDAISPPLARLAGGALDCTLHGAFPFDSPAGFLEVTSAQGARGRVELDAAGLHVELARPSVWSLRGDVRHAGNEFRGKLEFGVESWRLLARDLSGGELPVDGRMEADADVLFAPPRPPRLEGAIRVLDMEVEGEQVSLQQPARFDIEGGTIRLAGLTLSGKRSSLFVRAERDADGTLAGNVSGQIPGVLLALVWREARPSGRVELLGEISGTDSAPRFEGVARVTDGSLLIPGVPDPVTHISGVAEFSPEAIRLDGVDFYALGGTGVCDGRLVLTPEFELDLALRLRSVRWPLITGLTPILSGSMRVVGPLRNVSLSGDLVLNRTAFRRDIDLQKLIVEQLRAPGRVRGGESAPISLNIAVSVPGTLEIETALAHLALRGDVRIVGTTARYGVLGRLEALPGGELELSGVRYEIDRAAVTFANPGRIEPNLDVVARTTVQSFDITVTLVGTLDRLTPTFTSSPALPEMDIVSLLFVGRRAEEATQSQTGAVASSLITSALTGAVTKRARTLLDVDQLQIDPFASTQSGSPTARLTVAKQLSRDWSVTVSTNLTSNREEIVNSRWRLGQGIYLEANREADGSYSMEVRWQRRY